MKNLYLTVSIMFCIPLLLPAQKIDEPYQKGTIVDGFQKGIWEYFDKVDELALKIDYDNGKLLYLIPDSSLYTIKSDGDWITVKVDRYPRFMGSYSEIYNNIARYVAGNYPKKAINDAVEGTVILELTIDKYGKIINRAVVGENREYFQESLLEASTLIPNFWIGAIYNGEAVDAKIGFPITYKLEGRKKRKKKTKEEEKDEYMGKLMGEIVVSGYRMTISTTTRTGN